MGAFTKVQLIFGWKLENGWNVWIKLNIKFLGENFNRLKCMDGTNPNIIMPNENRIYMDESYKKDEIVGWMWIMNQLLDDNWK